MAASVLISETAVGQSQVVFEFAGAEQAWLVPRRVDTIVVDARGAQGSAGASSSGIGGLGGRVEATLSVTPGQTLHLFVGGVGARPGGGFNGGGSGGNDATGRIGGGGGGASDIRVGGTSLANRVIVAAGGGGVGLDDREGGAGGGLAGGIEVPTGGNGGGGGTQSSGGSAGAGVSCQGDGGSLGIGGNGGRDFCNGATGGGGAGLYGGGGAGSSEAGGGGSSLVPPGGSTTSGFQAGNGQIVLTFLKICGNGVSDETEECDDGNETDGDGCDGNCKRTACGNGVATPGEECDDGNTDGSDGCTNDCRIFLGPDPVCGDAIREHAEECDAGELNGAGPFGGSCCTVDCKLRPLGFPCRTSATVCERPAECTGDHGECPPNPNEPVDKSCVDGNACTADDHCSGGGVCIGGNTQTLCQANPSRSVITIPTAANKAVRELNQKKQGIQLRCVANQIRRGSRCAAEGVASSDQLAIQPTLRVSGDPGGDVLASCDADRLPGDLDTYRMCKSRSRLLKQTGSAVTVKCRPTQCLKAYLKINRTKSLVVQLFALYENVGQESEAELLGRIPAGEVELQKPPTARGQQQPRD